ncbi:MAG: T9SS type A sorting domain-containing protein, partial [Chitinophagaceae bacterium]
VTIDLLNSLGQKMKTVFTGTMTRGKHNLDISDKINYVSPGIYLLKIQASNNMMTVKLMISKK